MSTENAAASGFGAESGDRGRRFLSALLSTGTIFVLLLILWIWITILNPTFAEPGPFLAYLKRAAPLVILAAGAYFVLVSGNFDLSVGSLVTVIVVVAARLIDGDPSNTWPVIILLLLDRRGRRLRQRLHLDGACACRRSSRRSGMLLILNGAVFLWTGGAPRGALADNFRSIGRQGINGIPWIEQLPWSVILLFVIGGASVLLMRSDFGRQLIATGDNERAARLSGVRVDRVRILAFVLSGTLAAVAGILLGRLRRGLGPGRPGPRVRRDHRLRAGWGRARWRPWIGRRRDGRRPHPRGAVHVAEPAGHLRCARGHSPGRDHHRRRQPSPLTGSGARDDRDAQQQRRKRMTWRRLAGPFALLACCATVAACGTTDDSRAATRRPAAKPPRPPLRAARSRTPASSRSSSCRPTTTSSSRSVRSTPEGDASTSRGTQMIEPRDGRHCQVQVQEELGLERLLLERRLGQPVAPERPHHDEGRGRATPRRSRKFTVVDAEAKDDKQISDIEAMISGGKCDAIIISPNTTATLTPAVEAACKSDVPVIVFDRGVDDRLPGHVHPPDRRLRLRC